MFLSTTCGHIDSWMKWLSWPSGHTHRKPLNLLFSLVWTFFSFLFWVWWNQLVMAKNLIKEKPNERSGKTYCTGNLYCNLKEYEKFIQPQTFFSCLEAVLEHQFTSHSIVNILAFYDYNTNTRQPCQTCHRPSSVDRKHKEWKSISNL